MSTFGQTLRQAREAKGYTLSQVAQETHILVQIIEGMENEDFHRIPAAIYGRGFVKAFAACVDLDPQPLIREFMDIYEGRRAPAVQVRTVPEAPVPPPAPEPAPLWEPPSASVPEQVVPTFSTPDPVPPPFAKPEPSPLPVAEPAPLWEPPAAEPVPVPDPVIPEPEIPEPAPIPEPVIPGPVTQEPAPIPEPVIPEPVIPEPVIPEPVTPEPAPAPEPALTEPAPLWDPPADSVTAPVEQPPIVRGLDLFEQPAVPPPAPATEPPHLAEAPSASLSKSDGFDDSAFLPSGYEDRGPSAAERFRIGLSNVSDGVLKSVRRIPRSAWRIALLSLAAAGVVALLVFGCVKLYQATSTIPQAPCPNGACEVDLKPRAPAPAARQPAPVAKPAAGKTVKDPAAQNAPKAAPKTAPKGPVRLRATGTKVPALYAD